jgi:hypothetical protein
MKNSNIDYRIECLGSVFKEHADRGDKRLEEMRMIFQEEHPTSEMPKHYEDDFNLARALSVMVCEIERLKQLL